jgi:hypothetical protein
MIKELRVLIVDSGGSVHVCVPSDPRVERNGVRINASGKTWSAPGAIDPETKKGEIPVGIARLIDGSFQSGALDVFSFRILRHSQRSHEAVADFYKLSRTLKS